MYQRSEALYTLTAYLNGVFDTVDHSCLFGGVVVYCVMFYCEAVNAFLTLDTLGLSQNVIAHSTEIFALMQSLC